MMIDDMLEKCLDCYFAPISKPRRSCNKTDRENQFELLFREKSPNKKKINFRSPFSSNIYPIN